MSDWPKHALSEYIDVKHGFAFKGEYFRDNETDCYLLTPGNFAIGGGFKTDKFKFYDGPIPEHYVLDNGDLVVTMTDLSKQADTLGYSAFVPEVRGKKLLHNQRIGLVQFKNDELDPAFLYFLLRSREYRHHIVSTATGSTVKHTSPTKITSYKFNKPPHDIQVEIGRQLHVSEKKIELNRQINQTLEHIAQAIFKSWFVDFDPVKAKTQAKQNGQDPERAAMCAISGKTDAELDVFLAASTPEQRQQLTATAALFPDELEDSELGEIPKGWDVLPLQEICTRITDGSHSSPKSVEEGRPMASVKDMHNWGFDLEGCRRISKDDYLTLVRSDCRPLANDVLIAKDGSYLKHIFVVEQDLNVVILSSIAILRPNGKVVPNYLAQALRSDGVLLRMEQYVSGAVLQRIAECVNQSETPVKLN